MPLAENFPQDFLAKHKAGMPERIRAQIAPRTVIGLPSVLTTKPKYKLFLVLSVDPLYLFIISTEIFERYQKATPKALPHQLPIKRSDNPCLDHDSYIDCWKFWDEFDFETIVTHCVEGRGDIRGVICDETAMEIVDKVCDCPTFSPAEVNTVSRNLAS